MVLQDFEFQYFFAVALANEVSDGVAGNGADDDEHGECDDIDPSAAGHDGTQDDGSLTGKDETDKN